jgi:predicted nucleic acid-binding protein
VKLVVDASVAIKWFVCAGANEQHVAQAEAVADTIGHGETELLAPGHWTAEVIAVLARRNPHLVDRALLVLNDMTPTLIQSTAVLKRAADMAIALDHHLFDTLYHAVALEVGGALVTADEVYFNKAHRLGGVQLLADFAV